MAEEHPNRTRLEELFRSDSYMRILGMRLMSWAGGFAQVGYTAVEEHRNFAALIHGGAIFSVGDAAFAVASNSWGREAVALTIEAHYLGTPDAGEPLTAEATERSRTRRTGSYLVEVSAPDALVASLHAMVYRTDRWHFGAQAWPDDWRSAH